MLSSDDTTEFCYFIVTTVHDASEVPSVVGEHAWHHQLEWEGKSPQTGDVESLFT